MYAAFCLTVARASHHQRGIIASVNGIFMRTVVPKLGTDETSTVPPIFSMLFLPTSRVVMIGCRTSDMNEAGAELLEPFDGFLASAQSSKRLGAVPRSAEAKCYVRSKVERLGHLFGAFVQGIHLRRRNRITRSDQDP
jgi:hypothetical protein